MSRYIDADELLKYLSVMYDRQNDEDEPFNCAVLAMSYHIKEAPTIDAVEVVRCKDCKYKYMSKSVWECLYGLMITADGYCNYGEPKEIDHE